MNGSALSASSRMIWARSIKNCSFTKIPTNCNFEYSERRQSPRLRFPSGVGKDSITLSINRVEPT